MIEGLTLLSLQLMGVQAVSGVSPEAPPAIAAGTAQLSSEDMVLFAMELDSLTLTDTLAAYGDPADPLIPLGELARLLDLDISISPRERRVTGRIGEASRSLTIDLAQNIARLGGDEISLSPQDAAVAPGDIFIRASAIQHLLPLELVVDQEALSIKVIAKEKLPVQARRERLANLRGLKQDVGSLEPALQIDAPYQLFSPPAFDIALETGTDTREPRFPRRYDLRAAGDLLYAGYVGYLGSDEAGRPAASRLQFERRSPSGGLLGPLDATYVSGGDVFTPALPLGPRSVAGRGFSFTNAPLEQASVFQRINLRGELPIGYDVELYINDVLRSGQRTPVEGRYEFLDVPLVRGTNVIRIVIYGPRGERTEQTRIINVGGGQLGKGESTFDFGLVQQDRALIALDGRIDQDPVNAAYGKLRAMANVAYGLSEQWTVVAGAAVFPTAAGESRQLLSLGARGSLLGLAVQADTARDASGGQAAAIGLAGQPLGVSVIARHAEYAGGFIDETNRNFDLARPLSRHSELTLDMSLPPIGGKIVPVSFRLERDAFATGGSIWVGLARASVTVADTLVSTGFDYQRDSGASAVQDRLSGNIAASRFIDFKWQVRGVLDYEILPEAQLRALSITAARDISEDVGFRFGAGRSFGEFKDLSLQASAFFRLPFADIALTGDYGAANKDWRVGIRLAFGLAFDPSIRNYRFTRPGPAAGASAVFHAFTDANANGMYDEGERPVSNVVIDGAERKMTTGENGRAFLTGLGSSVSGRIRANTEGIDAFYVSSPPSNIDFSPRPGQVLSIPYPLAPVAEVVARVEVSQDGKAVGLSAVRVRLVNEEREPIIATTEFDGSVIFSEVPPGTYRFELDPEQAERLNMVLKKPITLVVTEDGAADVRAEVIFQGRAS